MNGPDESLSDQAYALSDDDEQTSETEYSLSRKRAFPAEYIYRPPVPDDPDNIYGKSHFGDFGEYMRRKRAKLQIQNQELASQNVQSSIFGGVSIYINGWTQPSVQDLRALIVQNGGIYRPYIDRKSDVTHVVATNLTPAKIEEYKNLKVIFPEWIVESVAQGKLLPWQNYMFHPKNNHKEELHRQSLFGHGFASSHTRPSSASSDALHNTDPISKLQAIRVPGYSSYSANVHAQRAMEKTGWREAHTAASPDFIQGYYQNSRLHHLSTWKAQLKELVRQARDIADADAQALAISSMSNEHSSSTDSTSLHVSGRVLTSPASPKSKSGIKTDQIIMHCDFDSFFVSVGLSSRPDLTDKPVVVCHSQGSQGGASSTSEIASCSYEARKYGVKNGMSLHQARTLCPEVVTLPYEFDKYKKISLEFYTILMKHASDLQAVSVDEALVDMSDAVAEKATEQASLEPAKDVAEFLRSKVKAATGCEVSIGIGENISLARLATRRAKPAGSYHLKRESLVAFLEPLDITDLHGIGYSVKQKCVDKIGTSKLGDLFSHSRSMLSDALGLKTGVYVYDLLRGVDNRKLESDKARQSVSTEVNYGIRFANDTEAEKFIENLSLELARRLDEVQMKGHHITMKCMKRHPEAPVEAPKFLGHGMCQVFHKSGTLIGSAGRSTSDAKVIAQHAWRLLKSFGFDPRELRGIGITIRPGNVLEQGQSTLSFAKTASSADSSNDPMRIGLVDKRGVYQEAAASNSLFPARDASKSIDAIRIVRALAPRQASRYSPSKPNIFQRREISGPAADAETVLSDLDEDLEPIYIDRVPLVYEDIIEPPRAVYRVSPSIKQRGEGGEKVEYTSADDLQQVLHQWLHTHSSLPPIPQDVQLFEKFLVRCVDGSRSTDSAIETAMDVMRWWKVLLRRYWPLENGLRKPRDSTAAAWWDAFEQVRTSMDDKIREKFGGRLSFR